MIAVAAALRLQNLGGDSLWADELYSLEASAGNTFQWLDLPRDVIIESPRPITELSAANGSPVRIWSSFERDWHPPLYFVVLRAWRHVFGSSDVAIRSLSVLASLLAIILLFDIGRMLFDRRVALWACLLLAFAHPQIWYAQEARSYALVQFLILGAADSVLRIERLGFQAWRGVGLGLCLLGAMLSHYFAFAGCVAIGVYALIRLRGQARIRTVLLMTGMALAYGAMWGPFLYEQISLSSDPGWLLDRGSAFFSRWLDRALLAPFRLFSEFQPGDHYWPELLSLVLLFPVFLVRRRPALLLPALGAVALLALPVLSDLVRHTAMLEHERYFLSAAPFVCLLVAGALDRPRFMASLLPACLLLYCVWTLPDRLFSRHRDNWRLMSQTVAGRAEPRDVLLFQMQADWINGVGYLANSHYLNLPLPRTVLLRNPPTSQLLDELRTARRAWLVTRDRDPDPERQFPGFRRVRVEALGTLGYLTELRFEAGAGSER